MAKSREKLIPWEFLEIDQSQTVARRRCQASCSSRISRADAQPRWSSLRTQSRENLTRHVSPRSPGRGPLLAASIDARPARATSTRSTPSSRRARWARPSRSPVPRTQPRRPRPDPFSPRFPGRAPLHWSEDARVFSRHGMGRSSDAVRSHRLRPRRSRAHPAHERDVRAPRVETGQANFVVHERDVKDILAPRRRRESRTTPTGTRLACRRHPRGPRPRARPRALTRRTGRLFACLGGGSHTDAGQTPRGLY